MQLARISAILSHMYRFHRQFDQRARNRLPSLMTLDVELLLVALGAIGLGVAAFLVVRFAMGEDHLRLPTGLFQAAAFALLAVIAGFAVNRGLSRLRAKPPISH